MDIGVIASHEEGFCNALMEKLTAGLPVVATNVGGNPEAVSGIPVQRLEYTVSDDALSSGGDYSAVGQASYLPPPPDDELADDSDKEDGSPVLPNAIETANP